jgi:allantoicase
MFEDSRQGPHFAGMVNMAQARLGAEVVYANDEFFGAKERLIEPTDPVFIPDKYDEHGKWMDGWETRRRREPGHDFCVIRLGVPGLVRGFDIETSHFTGNFAPEVSIDACTSAHRVPPEDAEWKEILPRTRVLGDCHNYLSPQSDVVCTHLRLNIYPDGGIARLRVYGEVQPDWEALVEAEPIDLLALEHGGRALACSDEHFGSMHNLNAPGRGVNMGDGWETARRRGPGHDWVILALGRPGIVETVEIDTAHFKGNYPDRASLQAARIAKVDIGKIVHESESWRVLLPESKLQADRQLVFREDVAPLGPVTHVRLNIFPDGGVSRLRLFGRLAEGS